MRLIGMNATTTIFLKHQEPRKEYQAQYRYLCAVWGMEISIRQMRLNLCAGGGTESVYQPLWRVRSSQIWFNSS